MRPSCCPRPTAASRSPLMPIDRSGEPEPVGQRRARCGTPRAPRRRSPCGPIAIRPAHVEAEVAAALDHRRDPLRARSPPCCSAPLTFTWTSTAAPGAWRAISAASDSRSTDCQRWTNAGDLPDLVPLQAADEVPAHAPASTALAPWPPAPGRSSRRRRPARRPAPPATRSTGWPLVTATMRIALGVAAGARRCARGPARSALGDASSRAPARRWWRSARPRRGPGGCTSGGRTRCSRRSSCTSRHAGRGQGRRAPPAAGRARACPTWWWPATPAPKRSASVVALGAVELVAARPDARAEVRRRPAPSPSARSAVDGALDHAGEQAPPPGVHDARPRRGRAAPPARSRRCGRRGRSPACAVTAASASTPACSPGSVTETTSAPWTWCSQVQSGPGAPQVAGAVAVGAAASSAKPSGASAGCDATAAT